MESRTSPLSAPNPNPIEFDNLYVDMNGIIHPCAHPESGPQPANEAEMFKNIANYLDRLVNVCRPRRLLYLAIDGVAPRAKMNQQRSRRFRSAQDARDHKEIQDKFRDDLLSKGLPVPRKVSADPWGLERYYPWNDR